MRNPGFQRLVPFVCAILFALSAVLRAETPPSAPDVEQSRVSPRSRTKPQVIYHVRPASNYAATLHSQQKTQSNDGPIESRPSSPQVTGSNPKVESRAQQQAAVVERNRTRPKIQKSQGKRPQFSVKSKGHGGNGHGGKGHKH